LAISGSRRTGRSTAATVLQNHILHTGVEEFLRRGTIIRPIACDDGWTRWRRRGGEGLPWWTKEGKEATTV
jgi:hypothetical protein